MDIYVVNNMYYTVYFMFMYVPLTSLRHTDQNLSTCVVNFLPLYILSLPYADDKA